MSSKIEVSRETLQRWLDDMGAAKHEKAPSLIRRREELRTLLAAPAADHCEDALGMVGPVVERQPVAIYMHMDDVALLTSEHVSGGVAAVSKRPGDGMTALYTAPPELAELQATVDRLTAENERLTKQWGDRPAYRTPEYESRRDAMWRRAHMVAVSKGYDHINMAIAAAPAACKDCGGCGGEWQGEEIPNSVCSTCHGSRGKTLEAEIERLKGGQGEPVAWRYCPECGCAQRLPRQGQGAE